MAISLWLTEMHNWFRFSNKLSRFSFEIKLFQIKCRRMMFYPLSWLGCVSERCDRPYVAIINPPSFFQHSFSVKITSLIVFFVINLHFFTSLYLTCICACHQDTKCNVSTINRHGDIMSSPILNKVTQNNQWFLVVYLNFLSCSK